MKQQDNLPRWLYNEFISCGVKYEEIGVAQKFEQRHSSFRDFDKEFSRIKARVDLKPTDIVLDLGCGSGAFVIPAAKFCRKVFAVDISEPMLTILQDKLESLRISNVTVSKAGFLTYTHNEEQPDVVITSLALHHLPDYWKSVALLKIANTLKPNGILYLFDVVFNFPISEWQSGTQQLLDEMENAAGKEATAHISSEFSTFDWILEGILQRVGFEIEKTYDDAGFLRAYVCRKKCSSNITEHFPLLTCEESQFIDARAIFTWKTPSLLLMENAGRSLCDIFLSNATRLNKNHETKRVLVCCGKGNNGGDGFVLARRLNLFGIDCRVACFGKPEDYKGDTLTNLKIIQSIFHKTPDNVFFLDDSEESINRLTQELSKCDWVIDALLGTGSSGPLRSPYKTIIPLLNDSGRPIYSVDIPSGLNANDGSVHSVAIRAKITTTLATIKVGMLKESAQEYTGELHVGDIGFPVTSLIDN